MNILIIEDDKELGENLLCVLRNELHDVKMAQTAHEAIGLFGLREFDLVILDINLPDMSGLDVLKYMRCDLKLKTQVLILSSKAEVKDKILGLDSGADDYLSKPFSIVELLARIRALLRRIYPNKETKLTFRDITIDIINHSVKKGNEQIALTPKEFKLLELFFYNKNLILTSSQIAEHIYDDYVEKSSHIINMHIRNIRVKLGSGDIIETVRGVGFRLGYED